MEKDLEKLQQKLVVLWFTMLVNIGILFVVSLYLGPHVKPEPETAPSALLIVVITGVGTFAAVVSFAVKRKFLERSVEKQEVSLVQTGLVIACAMCELGALLGLLERFMVGNREYYFLFLIAAAATALHFPRREHLVAASNNPVGRVGF